MKGAETSSITGDELRLDAVTGRLAQSPPDSRAQIFNVDGGKRQERGAVGERIWMLSIEQCGSAGPKGPQDLGEIGQAVESQHFCHHVQWLRDMTSSVQGRAFPASPEGLQEGSGVEGSRRSLGGRGNTEGRPVERGV